MKWHTKSVILVLCVCLLSGCMTPEQRAARDAQQAALIESKKEQYCANMGAPLGSDKYYDCRQWIEQELAAERQQNATAAIQLMGLQQQMQQQQQYQQQMNSAAIMNAVTPRPPIRCTSTPFGNTINTNCY